eukprot:TRINITY_DN10662_c0_g1_i1.p1 TRINITY_DN10662_c0_g1~~TRINITY_DN10662_c0_g1_i1.p1  ORF type:complete len:390 (-),score=28.19 TRINITY_DN10662_c0_g1_i1:82-1251(-)
MKRRVFSRDDSFVHLRGWKRKARKESHDENRNDEITDEAWEMILMRAELIKNIIERKYKFGKLFGEIIEEEEKWIQEVLHERKDTEKQGLQRSGSVFHNLTPYPSPVKQCKTKTSNGDPRKCMIRKPSSVFYGILSQGASQLETSRSQIACQSDRSHRHSRSHRSHARRSTSRSPRRRSNHKKSTKGGYSLPHRSRPRHKIRSAPMVFSSSEEIIPEERSIESSKRSINRALRHKGPEASSGRHTEHREAQHDPLLCPRTNPNYFPKKSEILQNKKCSVTACSKNRKEAQRKCQKLSGTDQQSERFKKYVVDPNAKTQTGPESQRAIKQSGSVPIANAGTEMKPQEVMWRDYEWARQSLLNLAKGGYLLPINQRWNCGDNKTKASASKK